jgi:hypothetical protein
MMSEKISRIEDYIRSIQDERSGYDSTLDLCSQRDMDGVMYRADVGHLFHGAWSSTILGALDCLYDELIRVGEINEN